jgi:hypothetical protein
MYLKKKVSLKKEAIEEDGVYDVVQEGTDLNKENSAELYQIQIESQSPNYWKNTLNILLPKKSSSKDWKFL